MRYGSIRELYSRGSKPRSMSTRGCGTGFTAYRRIFLKGISPEERHVSFWKPSGADPMSLHQPADQREQPPASGSTVTAVCECVFALWLFDAIPAGMVQLQGGVFAANRHSSVG